MVHFAFSSSGVLEYCEYVCFGNYSTHLGIALVKIFRQHRALLGLEGRSPIHMAAKGDRLSTSLGGYDTDSYFVGVFSSVHSSFVAQAFCLEENP